MAINFTDSPSVNDTVTQGDHTWTWDGTTWNLTVASATAVAVLVLVLEQVELY